MQGSVGQVSLAAVVTGALTVGYWIAALFFLRFWRETHDRLFAAFALSFLLLGVQRLALVALVGQQSQVAAGPYILRLVAFLILLWAIVDKNRAAD